LGETQVNFKVFKLGKLKPFLRELRKNPKGPKRKVNSFLKEEIG